MFRNLIKHEADAQGMSLRRVALKAGVAPSALNNYVNGNSDLISSNLVAVLKVLKLPLLAERPAVPEPEKPSMAVRVRELVPIAAELRRLMPDRPVEDLLTLAASICDGRLALDPCPRAA